jgi:PTS system nitrogen regulatory IIA component
MQLSVQETAELIKVSVETVYHWIDQKEIPFYKINDTYRFNKTELLEWATARGLRLSPDFFLKEDGENADLPWLTDALRSGGILYDVEGSTNAEVLKSIVDRMKLPEDVDRQFLYQTLVVRESLGSTGIGNGIAIPHARNPLVLQVVEATVTLCFLKNPIDFKAIDGKPVSILFTIVSPTVRAHLHLISRIAFVLKDPDFLKVLENRAKPEEIFEVLQRIKSPISSVKP